MLLLINPPVAKACEPPAGLARLAGALRSHQLPHQVLDGNLDFLEFVLGKELNPTDTWSKRAWKNLANNLATLRTARGYTNRDRYQRAVRDVNRILELLAAANQLTLANYQDHGLSALKSQDLLQVAEEYQDHFFSPWLQQRLQQHIVSAAPTRIGLSLNYLSQAVASFAIIGFCRARFPDIEIILGGGLVTSWMSNPGWQNPFAGLVDHCIKGPGEIPLLNLLSTPADDVFFQPDYTDLCMEGYLAPGFILPYAASTGCYWNKCSFCPEQAEKNTYNRAATATVINQVGALVSMHQPVLLHLLDNAISPALLQALAATPLPVPWYGFARVEPLLMDLDFCKVLGRAGCVMLKLGIESGSQKVLDTMEKGIQLDMVSKVLQNLKTAGIATYVYLLFGTPAETYDQARQTLAFAAEHHGVIGFLNLAIFNLPLQSPEACSLVVEKFYEGDLALYSNFVHPKGWGRREVRQFLDREFKRHPAIAPILQGDPPFFSSNHAPFFTSGYPR